MNKYSLQILYSVLIVNGIILSLSLLGPDISFVSPLDGETITLSFPDVKESLFKSAQENNENAANLLNKYETSDEVKVETTEQKETETELEGYLTNPEIDGSKALDNFFGAIESESKSKIVRVAHYGDSQIEGDRITSFLRKHFHDEFGGEGVGYAALDDISDNVNYFRKASDSWERFNVFNHQYSSNRYALSGLVFKYGNGNTKKDKEDNITKPKKEVEKPEKKKKKKSEKPVEEIEAPVVDTSEVTTNFMVANEKYLADSYNFFKKTVNSRFIKVDNVKLLRGSVTFNFTSNVNFSRIGVLYGKVGEDCRVRVIDQRTGDEITTIELPKSSALGLKYFDYKNSGGSLKFEFKSERNPEIYGFLFDGAKGVQIDNFAIRGHSGDGLLKIDPTYLEEQYEELNVKLIILQFGMNVMPTVKKEKDLEKVKAYYNNLFRGMKKRTKNASILVIGPGDMGMIKRGSSISHPLIGSAVEIIKACALENGCAFWDTYQLMGGKNSISAWAQKGYASRDGHFINKGQKIIAAELFKGINDAYKKFLHKKIK